MKQSELEIMTLNGMAKYVFDQPVPGSEPLRMYNVPIPGSDLPTCLSLSTVLKMHAEYLASQDKEDIAGEGIGHYIMREDHGV